MAHLRPSAQWHFQALTREGHAFPLSRIRRPRPMPDEHRRPCDLARRLVSAWSETADGYFDNTAPHSSPQAQGPAPEPALDSTHPNTALANLESAVQGAASSPPRVPALCTASPRRPRHTTLAHSLPLHRCTLPPPHTHPRAGREGAGAAPAGSRSAGGFASRASPQTLSHTVPDFVHCILTFTQRRPRRHTRCAAA